MSGWRISGPFLTDEERHQAARRGGLSGIDVDFAPLLGAWKPGGPRRFQPADPMLRPLQAKPLYAGTADPAKVQARRAKNKQARRSRKTNRKRARR